ncbi:hypothetical protein GUITHDRAFT_133413 [Guillardia theta CCMP2712]|uniref:Uncharacterized protein n=1 Tax=Guillardia theta (strain CCMP2712) TaxID=905079 RepID=L1JXG1_GUITC|nr:hypothetical protein GUITHDRAFT_133413 [Guillardia theta CCMP2712]EKX53029.1 hypothetical protein GUITHDRAFT_133413 [Guillardia theta CCMP2712]|eukprot:XP_005840009.1 hypothetical protein GUITHDRAFT_133413 [Guillardia theta CCMP2712]
MYLVARILYIASDTERYKSEFSGDVNKLWRRKVVITTPSIIEGVNYEAERPINTYCISTFARTLTPDQKVQQLARNRNCQMLFFYINYKLKPESMIYAGMPVHKDIDDCRRTYNEMCLGSNVLNGIMKKTEDMIEINREMKNVDTDNFCSKDSMHNKELMKILYRQDTQMLNYEHYYIKNLERLGMVVIRNYYKEEKEIKREKKDEVIYNNMEVMSFLRMRNIEIEDGLREITYTKDEVQEMLLRERESRENEDFDRMLRCNDVKASRSKEEQWRNRIQHYLGRVPENKREEYIERYRGLLMGGLSVKSDMNEACKRIIDPLIEHNKMVAYMYRTSHLEAILKNKISEDSPMNGYMSFYMDMWRTKEVMRKYLGVKDCFDLGCLDTGRYKDEEIEIEEDDMRNYFDVMVMEDTEENRNKEALAKLYNKMLEDGKMPTFRRPRITKYVLAKRLSYKKVAEEIQGATYK